MSAGSILRRALSAGTIGSLAMMPVGLAIRTSVGGTVNVCGELVVAGVLGRVVPWALFVEHMLISWIVAAAPGAARDLLRRML